MQETQVWSLGWEDHLEKEKATHFSILAWKIPYSPWGGKELDMTEQLTHRCNTWNAYYSVLGNKGNLNKCKQAEIQQIIFSD